MHCLSWHRWHIIGARAISQYLGWIHPPPLASIQSMLLPTDHVGECQYTVCSLNRAWKLFSLSLWITTLRIQHPACLAILATGSWGLSCNKVIFPSSSTTTQGIYGLLTDYASKRILGASVPKCSVLWYACPWHESVLWFCVSSYFQRRVTGRDFEICSRRACHPLRSFHDRFEPKSTESSTLNPLWHSGS